MALRFLFLALSVTFVVSWTGLPGAAVAGVVTANASASQIVQCKDVENFSIGEPLLGHEFESVPADNVVTPYLKDLKKPLGLRKGDSVSVLVIAQPKHGILYSVPYPGRVKAWGYLSQKGYTGHDRVVFLAKANGKHIRVVLNLLVGIVDDNNPAHCKDEKFEPAN